MSAVVANGAFGDFSEVSSGANLSYFNFIGRGGRWSRRWPGRSYPKANTASLTPRLWGSVRKAVSLPVATFHMQVPP